MKKNPFTGDPVSPLTDEEIKEKWKNKLFTPIGTRS